jgi:transposase
MAETLQIISERGDDMPLWRAQWARMGVPPWLDERCPTPGNWVGLRLGWVIVIWLTPILSEANHRLHHVEPWAAQRRQTLGGCTGRPLHALDVSADRLAAVLAALSDDGRWRAFEGALTQQLLRVDALQPQRVRLESTTASGYGRVTADGLCPCGHRKAHGPDLPQVKVRRSALAPLGLPVATDVVPGQRADGPREIPAIARVREGVEQRGRWSVGDCTRGALETRAWGQAGGDADRCPLSAWPVPPAVWATSLAPVWTGDQPLPPITRGPASGPPAVSAEGLERLDPLPAIVAGGPSRWTARRRGLRSQPLAQAGERGLRARLAQAQAAIAARNDRRRGQRRGTALASLQATVAADLARYHVQGVLQVRSASQEGWRPVRRAGDRPPRLRLERAWPVSVSVDAEAVGAAVGPSGWRVYATHARPADLSLGQAVLAYRRHYLVERDIGRLKGHPLALTPLYRPRDDQVIGSVRLLSVGLRGLPRLAFVVRQRLAAARTILAGWYTGTPKRATARPTTERRLNGVEGLTLTIIREGRRRRYPRTPLSRGQRRILALLDFPVDISLRLCPDSHQPP